MSLFTPAMTDLLEYLDPVIHTYLFLLYNSVAVTIWFSNYQKAPLDNSPMHTAIFKLFPSPLNKEKIHKSLTTHISWMATANSAIFAVWCSLGARQIQCKKLCAFQRGSYHGAMHAWIIYCLSVCVHAFVYTGHIHRVHALSANPFHRSSVISAISGNNEVSTWNMETTTRQTMLWASPLLPFSKVTDDVSCCNVLQVAQYRCIKNSVGFFVCNVLYVHCDNYFSLTFSLTFRHSKKAQPWQI